MKTISKTVLVAMMTATIGLSAIAPTFAQQAAAPAAQSEQQNNFRQHKQGPRGDGPMGGNVLGFERGADAMEVALVRLSQRVELTAEQQPLFDTFKTKAMAAAIKFETATEGLRPTPPVEGETPAAPNLAERLDNDIAIQTARLDALKSVQPAAKAFFASLSADQLASLTPQRPDRDGGMPGGGFGKGGPRHQGDNGHHGGQRGGPGAPDEAPADAPTPPPANG
ncbi:Spy/CpxP family protein refolding chaperone [Devosia psychrophila]|uniref:LTXXQ motif family protein n=1 Tax=Devosia psychrophila TaxID=728005 RepID=A0A1I1MS62_9HYPH|nr:Spy/CpxP family protein refolding chaperone [Devosia psychrophila]SFC88277.1 LTXXQ motif family protein [Devosia psychrophila]